MLTVETSTPKVKLTEISPVYDQAQLTEALIDNEKYFNISAAKTTPTRSGISAQELAYRWCITPEVAERTLKCTQQDGIRMLNTPITHRLRRAYQQHNYQHLN